MALRDNPELMRAYKREWIAKRRAEFFKDKQQDDIDHENR